MRPTRPTLRVVAELPAHPSTAAVLGVLARAKAADATTAEQILREIRLDVVESALLEDAHRGFADGGTPSRHEGATAAYGDTVYEVRDHAGAGWRGAIIMDNDGDPWLVFVDKHDQFHASVANALNRDKGELRKTGKTKGAALNYVPGPLDVRVRGYEDERLRDLQQQRDLIAQLRDGLREAHATGSVVTVRTPEDPDETRLQKCVEYTVEVTHGEPAETVEEANLSTSTVTLVVPMGAGSYKMENLLVSCGVVYVQPDANYREPLYSKTSALRLDLYVTHAKLAQLLSDADTDATGFPPVATPPDRLHWVHSPQHIEGVVTGSAVRSLCGGWFVPTQSESADLPVCAGCESILPLAEKILDELRLRAQS